MPKQCNTLSDFFIIFFMKKPGESIIAYILFCIIIVLLIFSPAAKSGAIEGINLCEGIIIPALLPILILCNILIKLKSKNIVLKTILLGMISGYPSGAILTRELYKSGFITSKDVQKIMCFNFCGGCAFIISAIGTVVYKSTKAGIVLYFSCVLSSLIIALFTKPLNNQQINCSFQKTNFSSALCQSVESSVKSLAIMSGYIILFSSFISIIKIPDYLVAVFEITNGICKTKTLPPLPICAFFLSFGGLCIHFQLISVLKDMEVKYSRFFIFRVISAVLSFFICKLILCFFPEISSVSAILSPSLPFEISKLGSGLSTVMIIGCALIVFDIENRKIKPGFRC